jgi:uncharacterized repeat protein (TIGR04138 family)
MPTSDPRAAEPRNLQDVVDELDCYPLDAFVFVQQGLSYTVEKRHGQMTEPNASHHITGQQLCQGLREFALMRWGLLARTVLRRWNVDSTMDFGRIVWAMVENGFMSKTESDSIDDFRGVYDFRTAFEAGYRIPAEPLVNATEAKT